MGLKSFYCVSIECSIRTNGSLKHNYRKVTNKSVFFSSWISFLNTNKVPCLCFLEVFRFFKAQSN